MESGQPLLQEIWSVVLILVFFYFFEKEVAEAIYLPSMSWRYQALLRWFKYQELWMFPQLVCTKYSKAEQ